MSFGLTAAVKGHREDYRIEVTHAHDGNIDKLVSHCNPEDAPQRMDDWVYVMSNL